MQPETVLELAKDTRIVAVKEASGSLDQACEILRARPAGFAVLSGEDSLAVPMIACGAGGVIAVVSNSAPSLYVETVAAALAGDRTLAAALQARIFPLMKANFRESNPIPVKWALERLGLIGGTLRLPLVPLSPAHHKPMEEALTAAGSSMWREKRSKRRGVTREDIFALLGALERGEVRAASQEANGDWVANAAVKEGILAAFRLGVDGPSEAGPLSSATGTRSRRGVRCPKACASCRAVRPSGGGRFSRKGVVVMPPAYVNVGAYVDEGSMIDATRSWGRARRSASASTSRRPRRWAASSSRRARSRSSSRMSLRGRRGGRLRGRLREEAGGARGGRDSHGVERALRPRERKGASLDAAAAARRAGGSRRRHGRPPRAGRVGKCHGLSLAAPVIVKYRDAKTDARTVLESALR